MMCPAPGMNEMLATAYGERSPNGQGHWPVVVEKGLRMGVHEEPTFVPADLAGIETRTLVIAGDDDMFPLSHTVSLYESLPNAQLAIVPGSSHALVVEKTAFVGELIQTFLEAPDRPPTMLPFRRRPALGG